LSPNAQDRQQLSIEELNEQALTGPFGGIQSELPVSLIEDYGFADCQNIAFRFGTAQNRPTFVALPALPGLLFGEFVTTFGTFYDSLGELQQVVFTNAGRVLAWNGISFTALTGPALTSSTTAPYAMAVINQKLCFSLGGPFGTTQVYTYDPQGGPGVYVLSSANSQEPLFLAEIGLHLMSLNVEVIGTGLKPQRYQWSGAGDPSDWTSFSSGINDQLIDLGPGVGLTKLGQYGFGYHPNGILQIIPTGIGAAPFAFVPIVGAKMGPRFIWSLQKLNVGGIDSSIFAGADNIYLFNQTSLQTIGDAPIGNRRRLGARQRIMADLAKSGQFFLTNSYATRDLAASPYLSYWLLTIKNAGDPSQCPIWIYNFDEENWTRWIFNKVPRAIGSFAFVPGTFGPNVTERVGISFADGSLGYLDFGQAGSETSYIVKSGKCIFKDRRHRHTNKKFRLAFTDLGSISWTLTLTNEAGQTAQQTATLGSNSGDDLSYVFTVPLPGLRIQWTLTAPSGSQFAIVELAPMYDIGGEQRGGTVDNN
jgi:hypothetical protein